MDRSRFLALMASPLLVAACARVDVVPVTDPLQPGIRYWRPALYVVRQPTVTKESSTCDYKTVTLPDKTEEYAITINAGVGSAKASPTLHEGWRLDSLSTDIDSKTAENLTAISNVLKAVAPGGLIAAPSAKSENKDVSPPAACSPALFRVAYTHDGRFRGLEPVQIVFPTYSK